MRPILLVVTLAAKSLFLLTFVHVIVGRTWPGFDLTKGLVVSRVLRSLDIGARVDVARRLTPATFFNLPSGTTITARIYLAPHDRLDVLRTWAAAPTESLLSVRVRFRPGAPSFESASTLARGGPG